MIVSRPLSTEHISVRDLSEQDVPLMLDYWYRSPPGFVERMGVDLSKLPTEAEMARGTLQNITDNCLLSTSKLHALAITCDGRTVGVHTLFPLIEGDHGIFHAHVWNPTFRNRGLGLRSYPKACQVFFERFDLKRILFKTPVQNIGAIRVKEKLGIPCIGEELIDFGIIRAGTRAKVFELLSGESSIKSSAQSSQSPFKSSQRIDLQNILH
ncbi:MAG: GNAT family N-acetyltransferase [Methylotenera sp.]|nr:GNAT family N-acetyltransferase [Oligoflexia bacterium]